MELFLPFVNMQAHAFLLNLVISNRHKNDTNPSDSKAFP